MVKAAILEVLVNDASDEVGGSGVEVVTHGSLRMRD
jgi:hypothetical protein